MITLYCILLHIRLMNAKKRHTKILATNPLRGLFGLCKFFVPPGVFTLLVLLAFVMFFIPPGISDLTLSFIGLVAFVMFFVPPGIVYYRSYWSL